MEIRGGGAIQTPPLYPAGRSSDLGSTLPDTFPADNGPVVSVRSIPLTALGTWRIFTAFPILPATQSGDARHPWALRGAAYSDSVAGHHPRERRHGRNSTKPRFGFILLA